MERLISQLHLVFSISLISESMTSRSLNGTGYPFGHIGSDGDNLISC